MPIRQKDELMTSVATARLGEPGRSLATHWVAPVAVLDHVDATKPAVNETVVSALVGKNLRRLRKQHRLSLEELARQSGVSRAMLGQIEQAKSIPSIKTLWQVAQALGVSVSWFLESRDQSQVWLIAPPTDSTRALNAGEGELRSLQQVADVSRDAFYELRLAPGAALSLPASTASRRVNVVVSHGHLHVDVEDVSHPIRTREALQYETHEALLWRNVGSTEAQAFVLIRSLARID